MPDQTDKPLVSVLCITYNQEKYIGQALESILCQKTNFPFEVIVHDDASTDSTLNIIRKIESRYPEKLKVIVEEENQYNNLPPGGYLDGVMRPFVHGKYIAVCEGDDYWINENKLQKQVDYLKKNKKCTAVCHQALVVDGINSESIGYMGYGDKARNLSVEDLLDFWDIPTASLVYRADIMEEFVTKWTFDTPVGDFPRAIYLASKGYIHYLPDMDSVYRYRTPGSYSSSNEDSEKIIERANKWIAMNESINKVTYNAYCKQFKKNSALQVRVKVINGGIFRSLLGKSDREYIKELGFYKCLKMIVERILRVIGFVFVPVGWRRYKLVRNNKECS